MNLRFRHSSHLTTRLRGNGVHEWDIRDLLGHASVRMTSAYLIKLQDLCKAVNMLGQTKPE